MATVRMIGVLSDTHGLLREEAKSRLTGCDLILHAGDVGDPWILRELEQIARVVAVRGNVDTGFWARALPREEYVEADGHQICVVHDLGTLSLDPAAAGFDAVVYGHSHKPAAEWKDAVLYLNPGSAGPQRFHLPVSLALLHLEAERLVPEFITL